MLTVQDLDVRFRELSGGERLFRASLRRIEAYAAYVVQSPPHLFAQLLAIGGLVAAEDAHLLAASIRHTNAPHGFHRLKSAPHSAFNLKARREAKAPHSAKPSYLPRPYLQFTALEDCTNSDNNPEQRKKHHAYNDTYYDRHRKLIRRCIQLE
jgi:hypothetical protein